MEESGKREEWAPHATRRLVISVRAFRALPANAEVLLRHFDDDDAHRFERRIDGAMNRFADLGDQPLLLLFVAAFQDIKLGNRHDGLLVR